MKKVVVLIVCCISYFHSLAQDTIHVKRASPRIHAIVRVPQTVFAELFGRSLDYSIDYDRRFLKQKNGFGLTVGISYCPDAPDLFSIPANINYLLGKKNDFLEIAGGATFFKGSLNKKEDNFFANYLSNGNVNKIIGVLTLGYRYQQANGFIFRIGLNGWLNNQPEKRFVNPFPYLSFGYGF